MLTIPEIEFFPDVVSEDMIIRTIDVGEQMIAIWKMHFDCSHGYIVSQDNGMSRAGQGIFYLFLSWIVNVKQLEIKKAPPFF